MWIEMSEIFQRWAQSNVTLYLGFDIFLSLRWAPRLGRFPDFPVPALVAAAGERTAIFSLDLCFLGCSPDSLGRSRYAYHDIRSRTFIFLLFFVSTGEIVQSVQALWDHLLPLSYEIRGINSLSTWKLYMNPHEYNGSILRLHNELVRNYNRTTVTYEFVCICM